MSFAPVAAIGVVAALIGVALMDLRRVALYPCVVRKPVAFLACRLTSTPGTSTWHSAARSSEVTQAMGEASTTSLLLSKRATCYHGDCRVGASSSS